MLRIEDICITVIERLIRQGYLEWKRKPDGKTEEEMEAKLDKHVILEKDVKEIGNSGIRRAAVGKKAIITDLAKDRARFLQVKFMTEDGQQRF